MWYVQHLAGVAHTHVHAFACVYLRYVQHMPLFVTQIFWKLSPAFAQALAHTQTQTNMSLRCHRGAQPPQLADVSTSPITGTRVNTVISVGFRRAHIHMLEHTRTHLFACTFAFVFPFRLCCPLVSVAIALSISIRFSSSCSFFVSISLSICSSKYYFAFAVLLVLLLFYAKL